jgi:hypothetical protein
MALIRMGTKFRRSFKMRRRIRSMLMAMRKRVVIKISTMMMKRMRRSRNHLR